MKFFLAYCYKCSFIGPLIMYVLFLVRPELMMNYGERITSCIYPDSVVLFLAAYPDASATIVICFAAIIDRLCVVSYTLLIRQKVAKQSQVKLWMIIFLLMQSIVLAPLFAILHTVFLGISFDVMDISTRISLYLYFWLLATSIGSTIFNPACLFKYDALVLNNRMKN